MTREDINDIINAICPNDEDYEKPCISPKYLRQELEQLALDQKQWNGEPTTKNNLGVDCVSRKAVDALVWKYLKKETDENIAFYEHFLDLPPVIAIRHKGHWIDRDVYDADHWKCSECGRTEQYQENFCPNCGADMREVVEDGNGVPEVRI